MTVFSLYPETINERELFEKRYKSYQRGIPKGECGCVENNEHDEHCDAGSAYIIATDKFRTHLNLAFLTGLIAFLIVGFIGVFRCEEGKSSFEELLYLIGISGAVILMLFTLVPLLRNKIIACLSKKESFSILPKIGSANLVRDNYNLTARAKILGFILAFRPMHFGFLWWWLLYVAFAVAFIDAALEIGEDGNFELTKDLIKPLANSILVALVAFISENLIREIVSARGYFRRVGDNADKVLKVSTDNVDKIREASNELFEGMEDSGKRLEDVKGIIGSITGSLEVYGAVKDLEQLLREQEISVSTDGLTVMAKKAISPFRTQYIEQTRNFDSQLRKLLRDQEPKIGVFNVAMMLSALGAGLDSSTKLFNTHRKRLIGGWDLLGNISQRIIKMAISAKSQSSDNFDKIEFYTLLMVEPEDFFKNLGKRSLTSISSRPEFSESGWQALLDTARKAAKEEISVKRHFFCVSDNLKTDWRKKDPNSHPTESRMSNIFLNHTDLMRQLENNYVRVKSGSLEPDFESVEAGKIFDTLPVSSTSNGEQAKSIWEIIDKYYHHKCCAGVLECKVDEGMNLFFDRKSGRMIDYFAVRVNEKWQFCLKSKVVKPTPPDKKSTHPDDELLDIEMFVDIVEPSGETNGQKKAVQEYQEKWKKVKGDLNTIFTAGNETKVKTTTLEDFMNPKNT